MELFEFSSPVDRWFSSKFLFFFLSLFISFLFGAVDAPSCALVELSLQVLSSLFGVFFCSLEVVGEASVSAGLDE